jgi:hypothetical protein
VLQVGRVGHGRLAEGRRPVDLTTPRLLVYFSGEKGLLRETNWFHYDCGLPFRHSAAAPLSPLLYVSISGCLVFCIPDFPHARDLRHPAQHGLTCPAPRCTAAARTSQSTDPRYIAPALCAATLQWTWPSSAASLPRHTGEARPQLYWPGLAVRRKVSMQGAHAALHALF